MIPASTMKPAEKLLASFDALWDQFSTAWKKAKRDASEKSIHDLRVSTRRLISTLEMSRILSKNSEIPKLQSRFKKVLKHTGRLRDTQVRLESLSEPKMPDTELVNEFRRMLKRRERRQIEGIRGALKRGTKRRLTNGFKDVRNGIVKLADRLADARIQQSLQRLLKERRNEFLQARRRFQPADEQSLHLMRIALKKLRYTVEAAQPVIGNQAGKRSREMHAFQQLLGNTRDVQLFRLELDEWASKKGRKIAIVPLLEQLDETSRQHLDKIVESVVAFTDVFSDENLRPAVERTHAAELPATEPLVKRATASTSA
jgi:CHAD domain-containing protein